MGKKHNKNSRDGLLHAENAAGQGRHGDASPRGDQSESESQNENPPRTTTSGWLTTPKFGSSTSGGGEIEPGPERD